MGLHSLAPERVFPPLSDLAKEAIANVISFDNHAGLRLAVDEQGRVYETSTSRDNFRWALDHRWSQEVINIWCNDGRAGLRAAANPSTLYSFTWDMVEIIQTPSR